MTPVQERVGLEELEQCSPAALEDLDFGMSDAKRLPPWHLYSSKADITVPWYVSSTPDGIAGSCLM